jgi:hypothetical protein
VAVPEMVGVVETQPLVVQVEVAEAVALAQTVRQVARELRVAPTQLSHLVDHRAELSSRLQLLEHLPILVVEVVEVMQQILGTLHCAQTALLVEVRVAVQVLVTEKLSMVQISKALHAAVLGEQTLAVAAAAELHVTRRKDLEVRYRVR